MLVVDSLGKKPKYVMLECSQYYEFYEMDIGTKTPEEYLAGVPLCKGCGGRLR